MNGLYWPYSLHFVCRLVLLFEVIPSAPYNPKYFFNSWELSIIPLTMFMVMLYTCKYSALHVWLQSSLVSVGYVVFLLYTSLSSLQRNTVLPRWSNTAVSCHIKADCALSSALSYCLRLLVYAQAICQMGYGQRWPRLATQATRRGERANWPSQAGKTSLAWFFGGTVLLQTCCVLSI